MPAVEIAEVAEKYLSRISPRANQNIMAVCPFHVKPDGSPERNPSFWMSLKSGHWLCHSCHQRGDLREFLKLVGVPPRVIDLMYAGLLEDASQELVPKPKVQRLKVLRANEPIIPEEALGLFDLCPIALENEGFNEEVLHSFDVGYDERNGYITFPLRDFTGRLIGIRGRSTRPYGPRYKTYGPQEYRAWGLPEAQPPKTDWLWNFSRVAPLVYIENRPSIFVVEGFKAAMWLHQWGWPDVVALGGSTMSEAQQMMLERLGGIIYLFLDNDDAGVKGRKEISRRLVHSLEVRIVTYDAPQPTDMGREAIMQALERSSSYFRWRHTCLERTRTTSRA